MGILSRFQGFHGADDRVNEKILARYGEPAYSLYTAAKLASLHQQIDVMDDRDNTVYLTKSKVVSIRGKTDILDAKGKLVAHIEKRPISLHEKHFVTMADGTAFTLSNELFHVVRDITNIEGLGWQLQGNVLGLRFLLLDAKGAPVAAIGQKMISLHNRFSMDIYQPEFEQIVVAIVIALGKMLAARRETESGVSFHAGSDE